MSGKINVVITSNQNAPGAVITTLRECQDIRRLTCCVDLIYHISDGLNLSRS